MTNIQKGKESYKLYPYEFPLRYSGERPTVPKIKATERYLMKGCYEPVQGKVCVRPTK